MSKIFPQVIPYQGSKRKAASLILDFFPRNSDTLFEPFVGSGAVTIAASATKRARNFHVSDILKPLVGIWDSIIDSPNELSDRYEALWKQQIGREKVFFNEIRNEFNNEGDSAKLLYLICRCVKNSVRFNSTGEFNQSPDNRRLGMHPNKMRERISAVSTLLQGVSSTSVGDFRDVLCNATSRDIVYMDPPYQGTSGKKDTRYAATLKFDDLCSEMDRMNRKDIKYLLSFDGTCGVKEYGQKLPSELRLKHVPVHMGRSSQATLLGRDDQTVESLYLSPSLTKALCIDDKAILSWLALGPASGFSRT